MLKRLKYKFKLKKLNEFWYINKKVIVLAQNILFAIHEQYQNWSLHYLFCDYMNLYVKIRVQAHNQ